MSDINSPGEADKMESGEGETMEPETGSPSASGSAEPEAAEVSSAFAQPQHVILSDGTLVEGTLVQVQPQLEAQVQKAEEEMERPADTDSSVTVVEQMVKKMEPEAGSPSASGSAEPEAADASSAFAESQHVMLGDGTLVEGTLVQVHPQLEAEVQVAEEEVERPVAVVEQMVVSEILCSLRGMLVRGMSQGAILASCNNFYSDSEIENGATLLVNLLDQVGTLVLFPHKAQGEPTTLVDLVQILIQVWDQDELPRFVAADMSRVVAANCVAKSLLTFPVGVQTDVSLLRGKSKRDQGCQTSTKLEMVLTESGATAEADSDHGDLLGEFVVDKEGQVTPKSEYPSGLEAPKGILSVETRRGVIISVPSARPSRLVRTPAKYRGMLDSSLPRRRKVDKVGKTPPPQPKTQTRVKVVPTPAAVKQEVADTADSDATGSMEEDNMEPEEEELMKGEEFQVPSPAFIKTEVPAARKRGRRRKKEPGQFQCDQCNRTYTNATRLKSHLISHSEARDYLCTICGKTFKRKEALRTHSAIHEGVKKFECKDCGRRFMQSSTLVQHQLIHSGVKNYTCPVCGKAIARLSAYYDHVRTHTDERSHPCQYCGKKFRRKYAAYVHERVHTGERPYACQFCGARFANSGSLYKHRRMHGVDPKTGGASIMKEDDVVIGGASTIYIHGL